jgi:hypothetical protein
MHDRMMLVSRILLAITLLVMSALLLVDAQSASDWDTLVYNAGNTLRLMQVPETQAEVGVGFSMGGQRVTFQQYNPVTAPNGYVGNPAVDWQ